MRFAVKTFGCKVNQYESLGISTAMRGGGFEETYDEKTADIVIINSCSVTESSDKKAKREIEHIKKVNPQAVIALAGCFPQAFPNEAKNTSADIIIGNGGKDRLAEIIRNFISDRSRKAEIPDLPALYEEIPLLRGGEKTRAFIKIEDGCNRFCSYCIIPYARGRVRSRRLESIAAEVKKCALSGQKRNCSCRDKSFLLRCRFGA